MNEATITINGITLTEAESMSVRVAVSSFRMELSEPTFRSELGPIADHYNKHLQNVEYIMIRSTRK